MTDYATLYHHARRVARSRGVYADADDVAQETMIGVWQALPGWDGPADKLVQVIAGRRAVDTLRRRRELPSEMWQYDTAVHDPGFDAAEDRADAPRIRAFLDALLAPLPSRYQKCRALAAARSRLQDAS